VTDSIAVSLCFGDDVQWVCSVFEVVEHDDAPVDVQLHITVFIGDKETCQQHTK